LNIDIFILLKTTLTHVYHYLVLLFLSEKKWNLGRV